MGAISLSTKQYLAIFITAENLTKLSLFSTLFVTFEGGMDRIWKSFFLLTVASFDILAGKFWYLSEAFNITI